MALIFKQSAQLAHIQQVEMIHAPFVNLASTVWLLDKRLRLMLAKLALMVIIKVNMVRLVVYLATIKIISKVMIIRIALVFILAIMDAMSWTGKHPMNPLRGSQMHIMLYASVR